MSELLELPLASIEVGTDRARDLDPAWVEGLSAIIAEQGLQQPIRVRAIEDRPGGYRLIAGLHRLKAHEFLGTTTIPAHLSHAESDDAARMEEVMENLGRYDLIALDRCHHLFELKQIYDRKHPDASKPGRRANGKSFPVSTGASPSDGAQAEVFGFAADTAEKIGLSKRAINMAVKIWTGLAPQTRLRLRGTDLARKQTELKALSEIPTPRKQGEVLDAIENPDLPDIGNVAQALDYLAGGVVCDLLERRFEAIKKTMSALDDNTFDNVIAAHEERVIASLKRRGRI